MTDILLILIGLELAVIGYVLIAMLEVIWEGIKIMSKQLKENN